LIDAGASIDKWNEFGSTPPSVALFNVRDGEGEVVKVLLGAGADPDA
jgi:hypothetical protein